jgi:hypothetical protein
MLNKNNCEKSLVSEEESLKSKCNVSHYSIDCSIKISWHKAKAGGMRQQRKGLLLRYYVPRSTTKKTQTA